MIISDFKTDKEVIRAKRSHVRDLYKAFTKNPKNLSARFLSRRHVNYMQDVGQKISLVDEIIPQLASLAQLVKLIKVYSVAKSKSLRLGSSTVPVTVIYYHSVLNKAMIPTQVSDNFKSYRKKPVKRFRLR